MGNGFAAESGSVAGPFMRRFPTPSRRYAQRFGLPRHRPRLPTLSLSPKSFIAVPDWFREGFGNSSTLSRWIDRQCERSSSVSRPTAAGRESDLRRRIGAAPRRAPVPPTARRARRQFAVDTPCQKWTGIRMSPSEKAQSVARSAQSWPAAVVAAPLLAFSMIAARTSGACRRSWRDPKAAPHR